MQPVPPWIRVAVACHSAKKSTATWLTGGWPGRPGVLDRARGCTRPGRTARWTPSIVCPHLSVLPGEPLCRRETYPVFAGSANTAGQGLRQEPQVDAGTNIWSHKWTLCHRICY